MNYNLLENLPTFAVKQCIDWDIYVRRAMMEDLATQAPILIAANWASRADYLIMTTEHSTSKSIDYAARMTAQAFQIDDPENHPIFKVASKLLKESWQMGDRIPEPWRQDKTETETK